MVAWLTSFACDSMLMRNEEAKCRFAISKASATA